MTSIQSVLLRIAQVLGTSTDTELAMSLGVSQPTISTWRRRGSIPYEKCVSIAISNNTSLDWLILGRGGASISEERPSQADFHTAVGKSVMDRLELGRSQLLARRAGHAGAWRIMNILEQAWPNKLGRDDILTTLQRELSLFTSAELASDIELLLHYGLVELDGDDKVGAVNGTAVLKAEGVPGKHQIVLDALGWLVHRVLPAIEDGPGKGKVILSEINLPLNRGPAVIERLVATLRDAWQEAASNEYEDDSSRRSEKVSIVLGLSVSEID